MTITKITDKISITNPSEDLDRPIIGIINGSESTILFDACSCSAHANELKHEMLKLALTQPANIAISHSHPDHWFGLSEFQANAFCSYKCKTEIDKLYCYDWSKSGYHKLVEQGMGSRNFEKILDIEYGETRSGIHLKKPNVWISGKLTINLGDIDVILQEIETSHCIGSTVLFVPENKLLFLGDILYIRTKQITEVKRILNDIDSFSAEHFIDSHIDKVLSRNELEKHLLQNSK
jgi:glyoxylase-like metal-dependent hydrolase (beta-lactamase superfamily II)